MGFFHTPTFLQVPPQKWSKRKEAMPGEIGGVLMELNVGHTLKQSHENLNPNRDYKKV